MGRHAPDAPFAEQEVVTVPASFSSLRRDDDEPAAALGIFIDQARVIDAIHRRVHLRDRAADRRRDLSLATLRELREPDRPVALEPHTHL